MSRCISTHLESSSTRICIWDKRVSLTEKLPLLYCTRIASFYSRHAYTCHYKGMPRPTYFRLPRIKRHKRPCANYSSTNALFHVPLTGDLVFKLNPGPVRSLDNGSGLAGLWSLGIAIKLMMLSAHAGKLKENGEKRGCLWILLTSSGRGIRLLIS